MAKKNIYRVRFYNQDTIYEIYARKIAESDMFGFIEVEEFVFGESSAVVVDPSEERLKLEFADVNQCIIPMNSIVRIDVVNKEGVGKITEAKANDNNISQFPSTKI